VAEMHHGHTESSLPSATRLSQWDPWLSVPRLLVVWLYRGLVFLKNGKANLVPEGEICMKPIEFKYVQKRAPPTGVLFLWTSCQGRGNFCIWDDPKRWYLPSVIASECNWREANLWGGQRSVHSRDGRTTGERKKEMSLKPFLRSRCWSPAAGNAPIPTIEQRSQGKEQYVIRIVFW